MRVSNGNKIQERRECQIKRREQQIKSCECQIKPREYQIKQDKRKPDNQISEADRLKNRFTGTNKNNRNQNRYS